MKNLYLINNKAGEPDFPTSFSKGCAAYDYEVKELSVKNLSYVVRQKDDDIRIFNNSDELLTNKEDLFFIRARKPFVAPTAVLSFVLEAKGLSFNERTSSLKHNIRGSKMVQAFALKPFGINSPDTLVTTVANAVANQTFIQEQIAFPMVVKQSGSKGEKVWRCDDSLALSELLNDLAAGDDKNILFQTYVENDHDVRVIIHYGDIIASIARYATDGFYNNLSQGGEAHPTELTEEEKRIAIKAAEFIDLELAGVDIVRAKEGPLLFEVNKSPDITDFSEAAGFDIPAKIAEDFLKNIL